MDSSQHEGVTLTAFDPVTADAVVTVLRRAGIAVWQAEGRDEHGDVQLRVAPDERGRAMAELGRRMEEVRDEVAGHVPPPRAVQEAPVRDPDDPRDGPPLTMERFADLRVLVVVLLGPLLVVTIAGPFLPRTARVVVFAVIAVGLGVVLARRR